MDPRHPELAISRLEELMKQYDKVEQGMKGATTSAELAQLEREGSLVVQEICLVAPRIHEAMMQTSRQRRYDLAHGVLDEPQDIAVELPVHKWSSVEKVAEAKEYLEQTIANSDVEKSEEELTFEQQHIKYTLELDKELEANEEPKKSAEKKAAKKAKK